MVARARTPSSLRGHHGSIVSRPRSGIAARQGVEGQAIFGVAFIYPNPKHAARYVLVARRDQPDSVPFPFGRAARALAGLHDLRRKDRHRARPDHVRQRDPAGSRSVRSPTGRWVASTFRAEAQTAYCSAAASCASRAAPPPFGNFSAITSGPSATGRSRSRRRPSSWRAWRPCGCR